MAASMAPPDDYEEDAARIDAEYVPDRATSADEIGDALDAAGFDGARTAADGVLAWSSLIGLISAEIFGQLGPELTALGGELLDRWIADTTCHFGLG